MTKHRHFVYILWLPVLCFYEIPVCTNVFVPASICISWTFALFLFGPILYSDLFILFYFIFIYSSDACFLVRDRKGVDSMRREAGRGWEELGKGKPSSEHTA